VEQPLFLRRTTPLASSIALRGALPPLATGLAAVVWALRHGLTHDFVSFSDGVYLYAAAHGAHAFYGHLALSLPPGALLVAAGAWKASPHVESVRLVLAFLAALVALLSYRTGRRIFGLEPSVAALAAAAAAAAPVHTQFVGLEGDAFLTPLVLALVLALRARRHGAVAALVGLGFLFKLTWAPFAVAAVVVVLVAAGPWAAARVAATGASVAVACYAAAIAAFGWSVHDLVRQLVVAESHSGFQLHLAGGILLALAVLWWPFLVLAPAGVRGAAREVQMLVLAGAASSLFMLKQGTFFNVVDPLEPLLVLCAAAGAASVWRGGDRRLRLVVALCAAGAIVHVASLVDTTTRNALPVPLGAALVDVDNARTVDRLAAGIDAHSAPDEPVLVNPFLALVANRREVAGADDWFILHALGDPWRRAKTRSAGVVSVDENVVRFDPGFAAPRRLRPFLQVDAAPLVTTLYAR
jgi:dolichyl-phosphate-mannose-protein mannosyltransferase